MRNASKTMAGALLGAGLLQFCARAQETVTFSTSSRTQLLNNVTFWSDVSMWHPVHLPDPHELLTEVNGRSYSMAVKSDVEQVNDNSDPYTTDFSKFTLNRAGKAGQGMAAFFPFIRECKRVSDSLRATNPSLMPFTLSLEHDVNDRYVPDWMKTTAPGLGQIDSTMYAEYAELIYYQCKTYKDSTGVDVVSLDPVPTNDISPRLLVRLLDTVAVYLENRGLHPSLEVGSGYQPNGREAGFLDMIHAVFSDTTARKHVKVVRVMYGVNIYTPTDAFMEQVADSAAKYGFGLGIDLWMDVDDHPTWSWATVQFPFGYSDWTSNKGAGLILSQELAKMLNTWKLTDLRLQYVKNFETSGNAAMMFDTSAKRLGLDNPESQSKAWHPILYYLIRHLFHHTNVGSTYVLGSTSSNAKLFQIALYDTVSNKACVFLVNTDTKDMQVNVDGGSFNPGTYDAYRLSANEVDYRLPPVNTSGAVSLPAQSTTILTTDYAPPSTGTVGASVLGVQNITPYSCVLVWDNTDAKAVAYDIYRGATKIASSYTIDAYYSATGLQPTTTYDFSLKARDSYGNYSAFSNVVQVTTHSTQKELREIWYCFGDNTASIPVAAAPDMYQEIDSVNFVQPGPTAEQDGRAAFLNVTGSNFGSRIRGYFVAPATGTYNFSISSATVGELYLSADTLPVNKRRIAASDATSLVSGVWYYFEVLHKVGNSSAQLQVSWSGPGQTALTTLRTPYMQPYPSNGIAVGVVAGAVPDLRATVSLAVVHGTSVPQSSLVRFCLPSAQEHVVLTLNDLQGRVVRRLVDGAVSGGMHVVSMGERSGAVPAGMYLLRFRGGNVDRCMAIALTR